MLYQKSPYFVCSSGKYDGSITKGIPRGFCLPLFLPLVRQKSASSVLFPSTLTRDKIYLGATGLSTQAFVFCFVWGKNPQQHGRAINSFGTD